MAKDYVKELVEIMARLRSPQGCPWDREQTHATLRRYATEEAAELVDAIEDGSDPAIVDELGDVLLQVVFHCQIASEQQRFDLQAVARRCVEKLIRRHPHVFGDATVEDSAGVLVQWDQIKRDEKGGAKPVSALAGVPRSLPALPRAQELQKRAAKVGFDWPSVDGVLDKIEEELRELREAVATGDNAAINEEVGDVLFSVVNLSRYRKLQADDALRATIRKFETRFGVIEAELAARGKRPEECTLDELDAIWNRAKG